MRGLFCHGRWVGWVCREHWAALGQWWWQLGKNSVLVASGQLPHVVLPCSSQRCISKTASQSSGSPTRTVRKYQWNHKCRSRCDILPLPWEVQCKRNHSLHRRENPCWQQLHSCFDSSTCVTTSGHSKLTEICSAPLPGSRTQQAHPGEQQAAASLAKIAGFQVKYAFLFSFFFFLISLN